MDNEKVPEIRDMTCHCKNCGDYHFASEINKDGLCRDCVNGKKPKANPKPKSDNDLFYGW